MGSLHRIKVLGRELQVKSTASPERVRQIEEYINSRIAEAEALTPCDDPLVIAIMALLNISESYMDISTESSKRSKSDSERISRLMKFIEETVR